MNEILSWRTPEIDVTRSAGGKTCHCVGVIGTTTTLKFTCNFTVVLQIGGSSFINYLWPDTNNDLQRVHNPNNSGFSLKLKYAATGMFCAQLFVKTR